MKTSATLRTTAGAMGRSIRPDMLGSSVYNRGVHLALEMQD